MIIPVVLAGGVGSRLWPLSREHFPKQCLNLTSENVSLLQATFLRFAGLKDAAAGYVVTNNEQRFLIAQQLEEIGRGDVGIILEPERRNTAPAIALVAFEIAKTDSDALMLVLPADHTIEDMGAFQSAIDIAVAKASLGSLVTFGIKPAYAETGYGYIKSRVTNGAGEVERFVEKPDLARAEKYLASGDHFWNSGMFMFKAGVYLEELKAFRPEIYAACEEAIAGAKPDLDFCRVDAEAFAQSPSDSIDYAVMEKTDRAVMVAYHGDWSDVGSWKALYDLKQQLNQSPRKDGNLIEGDALIHDSRNNYVRSEESLVALVGVEDLVVVQTGDAVLVADKTKSQEVDRIVAQLKQDPDRYEHEHHLVVHRPWGTYQMVDRGERHQVKRIVVKPGAKLSVQMHHHRAEHWIVVSGSARVTRGKEEFMVAENESTYIPIGEVHALENPGKIPLHLIEVQSGSYLGEDDIVRFTDRYGRDKT